MPGSVSSSPSQFDVEELLGTIGSPLSAAEARYVASAKSQNTVRAYRSDLAHWSAWCERVGVQAFPITDDRLARYLAEMAESGYGRATIERRVAAVRMLHRLARLDDPAASPRVAAVRSGIARVHGGPPRQAAPLMPPELFEVVDAVGAQAQETGNVVLGTRSRALVLLGFYSALRRSELSALDVEDVAFEDRGIVLTVGVSKGNQQRRRREQVIVPLARDAAYCPVRATQDWVQAAGLTTGPLFRSIDRHGNVKGRLSSTGVNLAVQRAAALVPTLGSKDISAHSLRAGFATYAHQQGLGDDAIAVQTRHRTVEGVDTYIRDRDPWRHNAATQLGL